MADLLAQGVISLTVDASGMVVGYASGEKSVRKFEQTVTASAKKVTGSSKEIEAAKKKEAAEIKKAADQAAKDEKRKADAIVRENERAIASEKRFLAQIEKQKIIAESGRIGWLEYQAAQRGLSTQAAPTIAAMKSAEKGVINYGISAKQTAAAMRLVPAQMTDIVTSLASGQPAYLVAIQQGGQLKDSFGGVGNMFKQLGSLITPARLAIFGFTGAALGLAYAFSKGAGEADAYNKALITTGNVIGLTADDMGMMARNIDKVVGTQAQGAQALTALAAAGNVSAGSIQNLAIAAIEMEQTLGVAIEETVKEFAELGKAPVDATIKLNEKYHYLTLEIYEQIKALQEQGKEADAARVAQNAYADAQIERMRELDKNVGYVTQSYRGLKMMALDAIDATKNIGRPASDEDKLGAARAQLKRLQNEGIFVSPNMLANAQKLVYELESALDLKRQAATTSYLAKQADDEAIRAAIEMGKVDKSNLSTAARRLEMEKEITRYRENAAKVLAQRRIDKNDPNYNFSAAEAEQQAASIAGIKKKWEDKSSGGSKVATYRDSASQKFLADLREQEAVIDAQIAGEDKLAAIARKRVEFERMIVELRSKGTLTGDQKDILANEQLIRGELTRAAAKEAQYIKDDQHAKDQIAFEKFIADLRAKVREADDAATKKSADLLISLDAKIAASRESRQEQYSSNLDAFGKGSAAQQQASAESRIRRDSLKEEAAWIKQNASGALLPDAYAAGNEKIKAALAASLADHEAYYAALREKQLNWANGMSAALQNYIDSINDVAGQTEKLFSGSFKGMEDLLVEFVSHGKLNFKSLGDFIVTEINRMIIRMQVIAPMLKAMQSGGSGGGFGAFMSGLLGAGGNVTAIPASEMLSTVIPMGFATGNVFDSFGPVKQFAAGDIFGSPTPITYGGGKRGEIGEAGYEAIMPVARGADGKLGVKASGTNARPVVNNNTINVYPKDIESFRRSEGQLMAQLGRMTSGASRFQ